MKKWNLNILDIKQHFKNLTAELTPRWHDNSVPAVNVTLPLLVVARNYWDTVKDSSKRFFSSRWWVFLLPVAGEAETGRPAYLVRREKRKLYSKSVCTMIRVY